MVGCDRHRSLNPDLVFDDLVSGGAPAVGDVKYRRNTDGEIKRSELNQITTFATGYRADRAAVIAFGSSAAGEEVHVGPIRVNGFNWDYRLEPAEAAADLAERWNAGWPADSGGTTVTTVSRPRDALASPLSLPTHPFVGASPNSQRWPRSAVC